MTFTHALGHAERFAGQIRVAGTVRIRGRARVHAQILDPYSGRAAGKVAPKAFQKVFLITGVAQDGVKGCAAMQVYARKQGFTPGISIAGGMVKALNQRVFHLIYLVSAAQIQIQGGPLHGPKAHKFRTAAPCAGGGGLIRVEIFGTCRDQGGSHGGRFH